MELRLWSYQQDGVTDGPFNDEQITTMLSWGTLTRAAKIAPYGSQDFTPIGSVFNIQQTPVPPPSQKSSAEFFPQPEPRVRTYTPEYAGFWIRTGAWLIDNLIIKIGAMIVGFAIGFSAGITHTTLNIDEKNPVLMLAVFLVYIAYFTYFHASEAQATPGKRVLGIQVTTLNGERISYGRSLGRVFAHLFDWLTLDIGYMMAGFTRQKRALHDYIAGTVVIYS